MKLTKENIADLKPAITGTWCQIAGDAYEVCDDDNEIAMELVLDANRMHIAGYKEADAMLSDLCMEHGFGIVRKELSDAIQLL